MWSYYGSKSKIIKYYPAPLFDKIIEPFAGTAQYALKYFERDIFLLDKYEVIVRVWKWLQQCQPGDILGLPRLKFGESVDDYKFDCIEAQWFVGLIITGGPTQPKKTAGRWKTVIRPNTQEYKIKKAAANLYKIKHWKIEQGDYKALPNEPASWYIDPPYQFGGEYYVHNNKTIDYKSLADWCLSRQGQIIVCENHKADWLPFNPLKEMRGSKFQTIESIYTNNPHPYQLEFI